MYNSVSVESVFFLVSLGCGAMTAFFFDLFRISRRIKKTPDVVVGIEDILFAVAAALILFFGAYLKNSGEIRWHGFIGFLCGGGIYAVTVKNRFLRLGTFLVELIIKLVLKLLQLILFPIVLVFRLLKKPVSVVAWYTGRKLRKMKKAVRRSGERTSIRMKNVRHILKRGQNSHMKQ